MVLWETQFGEYFTIFQKRTAAVVHAGSAVVILGIFIVHVYAAIWVKGTVGAMMRGTVTRNWARKHHPAWYREVE